MQGVPQAPVALPDASAATGAVAGQSCLDCGAGFAGNYCPRCGQEARIETPTVRQFLAEVVDQYVALEGKLGRTLKVLLFRPGQLTIDYLQGRRQRYVRPLKLYLTISVVVFTLMGVLPGRAGSPLMAIDHAKLSQGAGQMDKSGGRGDTTAASKSPSESNGLEALLTNAVKDFSRLSPDRQQRLLRERLADEAPYAMFFLVPYLAFLLRWLYRRKRMRYGEHLLFSLHVHTFAFIALAVGFLPLPFSYRRPFEIILAVYLFIALRRLYGGRWPGTLWRMAVLYMFYVVAVGITVAGGVLTTVLGSST